MHTTGHRLRLLLLAPLLAAVGLAVVLVTGSGSGSGASPAAAQHAVEAARRGMDDTAPASLAAARGGLVRVGVAGPRRYDRQLYVARAGAVRVEHHNPGFSGHDVRVQRAGRPCCGGGDLGGTDVVSNGRTAATQVDLRRGRYTLYCSLGGHWQAGMRASLVVR